MRKKILSLLLGLIFSVSLLNIGAQEIEIPVPGKDTAVQTLNVKISHGSLPVKFKNTLEALTEEQINRIVTTLEESGDVNIEANMAMIKALGTLSAVFETLNTFMEESMQNKIIYQSELHYDLSESEVNRALRKEQGLKLGVYGLILLAFAFAVKRSRKADVYINGFIALDRLASVMLLFLIEAFILWYIFLPILSIVLNRDYEIIKFLLQGA